eukprot:11343749-Prorocentrum_lima.AAC.1
MKVKELPIWCEPIFLGNRQNVFFDGGQGYLDRLAAGRVQCLIAMGPNVFTLDPSWSVPPFIAS